MASARSLIRAAAVALRILGSTTGESTRRSNASPLEASPRPVCLRAPSQTTRGRRASACAGRPASRASRRAAPPPRGGSRARRASSRPSRSSVVRGRTLHGRIGVAVEERGSAARCSWISRLSPGDVHRDERDPVLRAPCSSPRSGSSAPGGRRRRGGAEPRSSRAQVGRASRAPPRRPRLRVAGRAAARCARSPHTMFAISSRTSSDLLERRALLHLRRRRQQQQARVGRLVAARRATSSVNMLQRCQSSSRPRAGRLDPGALAEHVGHREPAHVRDDADRQRRTGTRNQSLA